MACHDHPDGVPRAPCDVSSGDAALAWPTDIVALCRRVAVRCVAAGVPHPVAAALVLAARGHTALDQDAFARHTGLPPATVRALEAGEVPWAEVPDIVGTVLGHLPTDTWLALTELDAAFGRGRPPHAP